MDWNKASKLLKEDLNKEIVKDRPGGSGKKLFYIDHFECIDAANRIFGHGGWSRQTLENKQVSDKPVAYVARVRITVGEVVRDGCGYGSAFGQEAHENAWKTAETDATKRALATFGYPLGLALYQKDGLDHVGDASGNAGTDAVGDHLNPNDDIDLGHAKGTGPSRNASKLPHQLLGSVIKTFNSLDDLNDWWIKVKANKDGPYQLLNSENKHILFTDFMKQGFCIAPGQGDMRRFLNDHGPELDDLKERSHVAYLGLIDAYNLALDEKTQLHDL